MAMFTFMALILMIVSATPISVYSTSYLTEVVSTESTGYSDFPSLAVDSDGNIHVAWYDSTDYGGSSSDLDVFYKAKIGGIWTATEVVSTESTDHCMSPSLAVDPDGDIHVAWYENTDYGGSGSDADVFYKAKIDGSWTTTEVVSTESTDSADRTSLAIDPDGDIHLAWYDRTDYGGSGVDQDVFYKRLEAVIPLTDIKKRLIEIEAEVDAIEAKLDDETRFTDDAELSNLETGLHAKLDEILSKLTTAVGGFYIDIDDVSHFLGVIRENLAAVALITAAVIAYLMLMRKLT